MFLFHEYYIFNSYGNHRSLDSFSSSVWETVRGQEGWGSAPWGPWLTPGVNGEAGTLLADQLALCGPRASPSEWLLHA